NRPLLPCTSRSNTVTTKTNQTWAPPERPCSRPTPSRHRSWQLAHLAHLQPVRHFRLISKGPTQVQSARGSRTLKRSRSRRPNTGAPPPPSPVHNLQPFGRSRSSPRQNSTTHDLPRPLNNGIGQGFPTTREVSGSNSPPLPTSTAPATPTAPPSNHTTYNFTNRHTRNYTQGTGPDTPVSPSTNYYPRPKPSFCPSP
ncbi:unnamed protein product, partial [Ixodes persulcatus]